MQNTLKTLYEASNFINSKWKSADYWGPIAGTEIYCWGIRGGTVSWNSKTGEITITKRNAV